MKKISIGLLGFGTVGSGVYHILGEHQNLIRARLKKLTGKDFDITIKKILVRDIDKYDDTAKALMTTEPKDILEDAEIDIICELIGGDDLALRLMTEAIARKKHVVTANKKAIFTSKGTLAEAALSNQLAFRYEAAVAGVIPIIRVLEESLISDEICELQGILNGSTNFILTKVSEGTSYADAMKLATDLGYLEADPSSDVDGYDAMYKLGILASLITGAFPEEAAIDRMGIGAITADQIAAAAENNEKIKLIARMQNENGKTRLSVKPEAIDQSNPLYNLDGSLNGVLVKCKNGGNIFLSGAGAGSRETATSVLGDIITIIRSEFNA